MSISDWLTPTLTCINQEDDEEKTEQIDQITDIYNKSKLTIAFLGPADEHLGKSFTGMLKLGLGSLRKPVQVLLVANLRIRAFFN